MQTLNQPILPGQTIGVVGSGQLGRMLALAAKAMGYKICTYSPDSESPAGQVCDEEFVGAFDDLKALKHFAEKVDVVTLEFENIPTSTLQQLNEWVPVYPSPSVLYITQNRIREKSFLDQHGFTPTPFHPIYSEADLEPGIAKLGLPAILKTAGFGYDGKGQRKVHTLEEAQCFYQEMGQQEMILEKLIGFKMELSVVASRGINGEFAHFGAIENIHQNHILDLSISPARVSPTLAQQAVEKTQGIMEALDVVGTFCVEFFLTTENELLINEVAPRPHNSGHLTIDGNLTSQFEQQLRAVCGLPLGGTDTHGPTVMANLMGDLWNEGTPCWESACSIPNVKLHLYGKESARPGRKMGHLTVVGESLEATIQTAQQARKALTLKSSPVYL